MAEPKPLLSRPVLPVASTDDARATCRAAFPRLSADTDPLFVHVIEKAGGSIDKASVEQRKLRAGEIFDVVYEEAEEFDVDVDVETSIRYGTNVAGAIVDAAGDHDASAIVFTPRGGGPWWDLLSGNVRDSLVTESDRPVVVLPDVDDE